MFYCDPTYGYVSHGNRCVQQTLAYKPQFQYLKEYWRNYRDVPKMSISLFMESHDGVCLGRSGGMLDEPLRDFLEWMYEEGELNKTMVMILADHGPSEDLHPYHQTIGGAVDHHSPTFTLLAPQWMVEEYPAQFANMRDNQQRLISAYNVHSTMRQFISFPHRPPRMHPNSSLYSSRELSLWDPIRMNVTCAEAGIPREYCHCDTDFVDKWRYLELLSSPAMGLMVSLLLYYIVSLKFVKRPSVMEKKEKV